MILPLSLPSLLRGRDFILGLNLFGLTTLPHISDEGDLQTGLHLPLQMPAGTEPNSSAVAAQSGNTRKCWHTLQIKSHLQAF